MTQNDYNEHKAVKDAIRHVLQQRGLDAHLSVIREQVMASIPNAIVTKCSVSMIRSHLLKSAAPVAESSDKPPVTSTYDQYRLGEDFWCLCGANSKHVSEILDILRRTDFKSLVRCVEAWKSLVDTAGGIEQARRVLNTMRDSSMI